MEDIKISSKQFIQLIFISRIVIAITYMPAIASPPRNQDVWISELLSFPILILMSLPVYFLWRRFPSYNIFQCSKILLGKAGVFIGLLFVWYFIDNAAMTLSQLGEFLVSALMQETPILFFTISMTVLCTYAVSKGIEVMGQMAEFIAPLIIISVIVIFALLMKDMKLESLTPILEKGFLPVLHGGFTTSGRTVEFLSFAMLLPYLNDYNKGRKAIVSSILLLVFIFLVSAFPVITIWGIKQAKNLPFPFYSVIKVVNIGGFLQRIDAIYLSIWILGIFLKISLTFYFAALGISELFNFNDFKPFIIPVGSILIPLSILVAPNIVELRDFLSYKVFVWYSLFYTFFIPSLLLIVSILRKKGERNK